MSHFNMQMRQLLAHAHTQLEVFRPCFLLKTNPCLKYKYLRAAGEDIHSRRVLRPAPHLRPHVCSLGLRLHAAAECCPAAEIPLHQYWHLDGGVHGGPGVQEPVGQPAGLRIYMMLNLCSL